MASLLHLSLLLCVLLLNTNNAVNRNPFRYKGWGWTPQFKGLNPDPALRKITEQCIVKLANDTATFNLFPLHLSKKNQIRSYKVKDERSLDDPNDDYLYEFNVCGPVGSVPDGCKQAQMMKNTWDGNPRMYCEDNQIDYNNKSEAYCTVDMTTVGDDTPVYAYQMSLEAPDDDGNQAVRDCYHLSDPDGGPGTWELINEDNPSEGVVVTYHDGDWSPFCEHNREINIHFVCGNDYDTYGIQNQASSQVDYPRAQYFDANGAVSSVEEPELCQYKLEFHTIYGCPSECPIVQHKMCNGVGLCGYDWSIKQPRCYCYSWWTGDSCTEFDVAQVFKPRHDPIDADLTKNYVTQFEHTLKDGKGENQTVSVVYDLEEFKANKSKPYVMRDIDGYGAFARYYVWNFFEDIDMDAPILTVNETVTEGNKTITNYNVEKTLRDYGCPEHTGYCKKGADCSSGGNLVGGQGYVYQIDTWFNTCVMAGGKDIDWQLMDTDNPAKGVTLDFQNGDYCMNNKNGTSINRHFKITLQCPDDNKAYVKLSEEENRIFDAFVTEDNFKDIGSNGDTDFCGYYVTIKSAFACPDECLSDATETERTDDVSICSTQGMCASDPFSGHVHCLCDKGWTGDKCDVVYVAPLPGFRTKNMGSYIAAIVIISVILVGICWFGYKKISAQKQKVKELEIKLVNYQSSGGGANTFNDDPRPPQIDDMPQSKGPSLSDKIKNKLGRNKRGKYANISAQNDDDADEQELFNVKVKMNGGHSDDDDEENDDDAEYNKPKHQFEVGGDDDDDESESDSDGNEDDK